MNINIVQKYWHIIDQKKNKKRTFTSFIYICNKEHYISSISFSSIFINGVLFKVGID